MAAEGRYDEAIRLIRQDDPFPAGFSAARRPWCIGCGLCAARCHFDAIHLERDIPAASEMGGSDYPTMQ